jgi:hypothetical protein
MNNEKEKDIREVEERIRKIDDFLLAVNSTIEGVLEENNPPVPRVRIMFNSKMLDITFHPDTFIALQDLVIAERGAWGEMLTIIKGEESDE